MSGNSTQFCDYIQELLASIPNLSTKRFFGGSALKTDDLQFAMMMADQLFFVVDETTRPQYEALGMECFWYNTKKGKVNVKKYYQAPDEWLDEPDLLNENANKAIEIARKLKK